MRPKTKKTLVVHSDYIHPNSSSNNYKLDEIFCIEHSCLLDVTLCSVEDEYWRLKGNCCFHQQGKKSHLLQRQWISQNLRHFHCITWRRIPENNYLNIHDRVNLKPIHSFHSVICLTTGPKPPLKRFLHVVRSRASSFKWEYPLLSLRPSSSFLRLLPRLLVTSISPFIFPSIACFRRQFLRKMWPTQLAFRFLISYTIFLCSLTICNTSSFLTCSVQLIFSILLQHHISKLSRYFWTAARSVQVIIWLYLLYMGSSTFHILYFCAPSNVPELTTM